jgi:hypothetical protein
MSIRLSRTATPAQTFAAMCSGDRRAKSSAWRRPPQSSSQRYATLCVFWMGVVGPWQSRSVRAVIAAFPSKIVIWSSSLRTAG